MCKYLVKIYSIFFFFMLMPCSAMAFYCTSNGNAIGGSGSFTIPIDVTLKKSTDGIVLTDMSTYTTCGGSPAPYSTFQDALRTTSNVSISPLLINIGYTGFISIYNTIYPLPIGQQCVWPSANCNGSSASMTTPLYVKIGMKRTTPGGGGLTIPAGTEIARLEVQQRSGSSWGWNKTWIFTLKSQLVIPAYTCSVTNSEQAVALPQVKAVNVVNNGPGRYTKVSKSFDLIMNCDPRTSVSIKFDGTTMPDKNDVLANKSSGNENLGIQILFNDTALTYGVFKQFISDAQNQETLNFTSYYYYRGGSLTSGPVSAVSTFTMDYE